MSFLIPRSLSGRIIALTLMAVILAQIVSFALVMQHRNRIVNTIIFSDVRTWVVAMARVLEETPEEGRTRVLEAASSHLHWFRLEPRPLLEDPPQNRRQAALTATLRQALGPQFPSVRTYFGHGPATEHPYAGQLVIEVAIELPDGDWLHFGRELVNPAFYWAVTALLTIIISGLLMAIVVVLVSRRIARPLDRLAAAAERLGRGEAVASLNEEGPEDIRRTTRAFNRMRQRLERFVADRTRMIAAIAHDLRTPLTAMRLRLELLPEDDNRRRMQSNLEDMMAMAEASLAFARGEAASEASRAIDLGALLDVVCEDYRALGYDVEFEAERRVVLNCRPGALKRALRNLIDNAVTYGTRATVTLTERGDEVCVCIDDYGAGIPAAELENVFDPFVRLDSARSSSGNGLGLSIARTIVHAHGGELELVNRAAGGLSARLQLPKTQLAGS